MMKPPTDPLAEEAATTRHLVAILDEVHDALDHIGAVADLLRLAQTEELLGNLRVETVSRAGAFIEEQAAHIRRLLAEA